MQHRNKAQTLQTEYRHGKLSKILIALILFLTLLLAISGVTLLYYALIAHPAQLHIQATATAHSVATTRAQIRATSQAQATSTAYAQATAQAQATSTAYAQATVQAQATASALQNIYTQSTSGKPDRLSTLAYETGFHWDIYPTRDNGGCAFTNNALHSVINTTGYYTPCLAHDTHYGDLALEVQMAIIHGDEGGIIIHSDDRSKNFYSFRIRRDGTYRLALTRNNGPFMPLITASSSLINKGTGRNNTLSIVIHASNIYLYINHHYVGSASDSTLRTGSIGTIAVNHKHKTDVAFTNLRIWKL